MTLVEYSIEILSVLSRDQELITKGFDYRNEIIELTPENVLALVNYYIEMESRRKPIKRLATFPHARSFKRLSKEVAIECSKKCD